MDANQFDRLARLLGTAGSRRSALAALLTGIVLPRLPGVDVEAKQHRRRTRSHDRHRHHPDVAKQTAPSAKHDAPTAERVIDTEQARDDGRGGPSPKPQSRKRRGSTSSNAKDKNRQRREKPEQDPRRVRAEAACYTGAPCSPGPTKDLAKCDLAHSTGFKGKSCAKCNLSEANLSGVDASNANLSGANLQKACLVDATFSGANFSGVNTRGAILCRTTMANGSLDNSGCGKGTPCCPVCDATHPCPSGQVCCNGVCKPGNCCTSAHCTDRTKPICQGTTCVPCASTAQCGAGKRCCSGECRSGDCCAAGDCADRACSSKTCEDNQCRYPPQADGAAGTACASQCCSGSCCAAGRVCHQGSCCAPPTRQQTCQNRCGEVLNACGQAEQCPACLASVCQDATCTSDHTCVYTPSPDDRAGTLCDGNGAFCCRGACCADGDVCRADGCCTPDRRQQTCQDRCGSVADNCGQVVTCDPCPTLTCRDSVCNGENRCEHTKSVSGQAGPDCATLCCDGNCCASGDVCFSNDCCTPLTKAQACAGNACGQVSDGCGGSHACSDCDPVTCKVVDCIQSSCQVVGNQPNMASCTMAGGSAGVCCNGRCQTCCGTDASTCPDPGACQEKHCLDGECAPVNTAQRTVCPGGICCDGTCQTGATCCGNDNINCPPPPPCYFSACRNGQCVHEPFDGLTCTPAGGGAGVCCGGACETNCPTCCNGICCPSGQVCCHGVCRDCCSRIGNFCPNPAGVCGAAPCPEATGVCQTKACVNDACTVITAANGSGTGGVCGNQLCCDGACADCCGGLTHLCPDPGVCNVKGCSNGVCQPQIAVDGTNPNNACPGGVCCNGACCPAGQVCCNGVCAACCGDDAGNCPNPGVCKIRTCVNNVCVPQNIANGGDPGDRCLGDQFCCNGSCEECCGADAQACPPPPACKANICSSNICAHQNLPNGLHSSCPGSTCCNGVCCPSGQVCCNGVCRECCGSDGSTCPNPGPCKTRACSNNTCVPQPKPNNTQDCGSNGICCNGACAACCEDFVSHCGTPAPCQFVTCSNGTCVVNNKPDTTDPAQVSQCDSPGPCRIKACVSGQCTPQNRANGTDVGDLCPGSEICCDGLCRGCCDGDAVTCPFPTTCQHNDCINNVCTPRTVMNGPGANCNTVCCRGVCCAERCGDFDLDCVGEVCRPSQPPQGGPSVLRCCLPAGGVPGLVFDFDVFDFVPNAEECCSHFVSATLPYICL